MFYNLFEKTIFAKDYLDLDDFVVSYHVESLSYNQYETLEKQYGDVEDSYRDVIIEIVYNVIFYSDIDNETKIKIAGFLARYKMLFQEEEGYRKLVTEEMFKSL